MRPEAHVGSPIGPVENSNTGNRGSRTSRSTTPADGIQCPPTAVAACSAVQP